MFRPCRRLELVHLFELAALLQHHFSLQISDRHRLLLLRFLLLLAVVAVDVGVVVIFVGLLRRKEVGLAVVDSRVFALQHGQRPEKVSLHFFRQFSAVFVFAAL